MPSSKLRFFFKISVDIVLLLSVITGIFLVKKLWPLFERGMYCYDGTLTYPYKDYDTISDSLLLFYGVALPINVMCLVEFLRVRSEIVSKEFQLFGRKFNSWLSAVYSSIGVFLFGCAISQLFTNISKSSLGYLRPNFIEVCQPDWHKMNCSSTHPLYIDPILCTNDDWKKIKEARMSFPSGHASFSTFTMLYLVIYLQARLFIRDFKLLRPVLQLLCLLLNLFTCYTRITDYKHHWSDIVGGIVLGGSIALFIAFFVSDLFTKKATKTAKSSTVMLEDYHQPPAEELHANIQNP